MPEKSGRGGQSPPGTAVSSAAEALREHWWLGEQPIESVTAAIEDGGGVVVEDDGDDLFDGLSGWADEIVPVVVVSSGVSDDRRRFSLARPRSMRGHDPE